MQLIFFSVQYRYILGLLFFKLETTIFNTNLKYFFHIDGILKLPSFKVIESQGLERGMVQKKNNFPLPMLLYCFWCFHTFNFTEYWFNV